MVKTTDGRVGRKTKIAHSFSERRIIPKDKIGKGQYRSNATIRRLLMYKGKVKRNEKGEIVKGSVIPMTQKIAKGELARIAPDRRWFGNTRVIGQKEMTKFRDEISNKIEDPYTVLMKQAKIPFSLLREPVEKKDKIMNKINFEETFGTKSQRKRPKLSFGDYKEFVDVAEKKKDSYVEENDLNHMNGLEKMALKKTKKTTRDPIFEKGQSKRIWGELYKVIDASDVIIQVLDARDPMGTRSNHIEKYMKSEKNYKHLIFVLNKCDLVPTWVTVRWVKVLSKEVPTLAFHASITNPFGKGSLIQLLRQFSQLHKDKKSISVGFIGYPNVGKSSVINTLKQKKVCCVAPIPGETKVWQYVNLTSKIFLIDCPGVVYSSSDTATDVVLKSVVRVEKLNDDVHDHVSEVLNRVKKQYIQRHYRIIEWVNHIDFLKQLAHKSGKLLKGGVPDIKATAKRVLYDWQRGKIPWFKMPPFENDEEKKTERKETNIMNESDVIDEEEEIVEDHNVLNGIDQNFKKIKGSSELRYDKSEKYNDEVMDDNKVKVEEEIEEVVLPEEDPINFDDIYSSLNNNNNNDDDESGSDKKDGLTQFIETTFTKKLKNKKKKKVKSVTAKQTGYIPKHILERMKNYQTSKK